MLNIYLALYIIIIMLNSLVKPYILFTVTPLHVGSGRSIGEAVDLPVQKDNLGFPTIWGSSLKGALRSSYHRAKEKRADRYRDMEREIFGAEYPEGHEKASSLSVFDAKLLMIPTSSLKGVYAFVTTPLLLKKALTLLSLIMEMRGRDEGLKRRIDSVKGLLESSDSPRASSERLVFDGKVMLAGEVVGNVEVSEDLASKIKVLLEGVSLPIEVEEIASRTVLLPDNDLSLRVIRRSLIVTTRIAVNYDKKVVKHGHLWSEEYVPEMTLYYTALVFQGDNSQALLGNLVSILNPGGKGDDFYLVLGGHESIGKGIVKFCSW